MAIIYLIESVRDYDTVYKIGYTKSDNSKKNRIRNLQTGNDGELKIVYEFHTKHGTMLEIALHNFYKYANKKNEWFELDILEISNFIDTCKRLEKNLDLIQENHFIQKYKNR